MKLRPYQIEIIEKVHNAMEKYNSIMVQMPTGTGKTTVFADIIKKYTRDNPDNHVLILAHREELIQQIHERLSKDVGILAGLIRKQHIHPGQRVQISSIQYLDRTNNNLVALHRKFHLVIIDEAHHATASTYRKLWKKYPTSNFLGFTATPYRLSKEGFDDLFEKLILSPPIKDFIKQGHLCDIRYFVTSLPDLNKIQIDSTLGDYVIDSLSELMRSEKVMADLIESYKKYADGKKTIVFAVDVNHSKSIVERFNNIGIPAEHVDANTPTEERSSIVDRFRNNEFDVLCNVDIFGEGFDCPDVDVVQLARPTKSLSKFLQQVGRCMRPLPNKLYGIILDNAGLYKEHGLPKMHREWFAYFCGEKPIINYNDKLEGFINGDKFALKNRSKPEEIIGLELEEIGELESTTTFKERKIKEYQDKLDIKAKELEEIKNEIAEIKQALLENTKKVVVKALTQSLETEQIKQKEIKAEIRAFTDYINELQNEAY